MPTTATDFASLGLTPLLHPALEAAGIRQPTEVQQAAWRSILDGGDAVLLSETGSGKTLAYALPLLHQLIEEQSSPTPGDGDDDEAVDALNGNGIAHAAGADHRVHHADQVLVLVPNRDLCTQVFSVFRMLLDTLPDNLHRQLSLSSLVSDAHFDPGASIMIATPAVALNTWRGPQRVRTVVLDEADALLAGSFKPAARSTYPVEILIAAVKRSAKLEAEAGGRPPPAAARAARGQRTAKHGQRGPEGRAIRALAHASRQFVLVGATMPNAGTRNAEEHVRRLFPLASWHRAAQVHRNKASLRHFFVRIDESNRGEALRHAVQHGPKGQVLIFTNTVQQAEEAYAEAELLLGRQALGLFHAEVPSHTRATILQDFADRKLEALVCTGLASRGLDFVDVAHVVQYDVALNAVEFMHRVGRTARAGNAGVSTTLYAQERDDLVHGLRDALASGSPMQHISLRNEKQAFPQEANCTKPVPCLCP